MSCFVWYNSNISGFSTYNNDFEIIAFGIIYMNPVA